MIWVANGLSVAIPSRTADREPAMLTTSVCLRSRPGRERGGVDDARREPGRAKRLGDTEQLTIQDVPGRLGRHVPGGYPGAADRHHQVNSADNGRVQRVADLHLVGGHHHDAVDDKPRLIEQSVTSGPLWSSSP